MFNANSIKNQIIEWIKQYFEANADNNTKAIIGISGGKDSTVAAALCVSALGKERILGVLLPQGEQNDIDTAIQVCEHLGIEYININIGSTTDNLYSEIKKADLEINSIVTTNLPARIRLSAIYAVSASVGGRVICTDNLSENYIGYATKFGIGTAGDFSPLSSLTATEVKEIGYALSLPEIFMEKPPADGLCGKTDEESLGFSYEILDNYIRSGTCENAEIKSKIDRLHKQNLHKQQPIPKFELLY